GDLFWHSTVSDPHLVRNFARVDGGDAEYNQPRRDSLTANEFACSIDWLSRIPRDNHRRAWQLMVAAVGGWGRDFNHGLAARSRRYGVWSRSNIRGDGSMATATSVAARAI